MAKAPDQKNPEDKFKDRMNDIVEEIDPNLLNMSVEAAMEKAHGDIDAAVKSFMLNAPSNPVANQKFESDITDTASITHERVKNNKQRYEKIMTWGDGLSGLDLRMGASPLNLVALREQVKQINLATPVNFVGISHKDVLSKIEELSKLRTAAMALQSDFSVLQRLVLAAQEFNNKKLTEKLAPRKKEAEDALKELDEMIAASEKRLTEAQDFFERTIDKEIVAQEARLKDLYQKSAAHAGALMEARQKIRAGKMKPTQAAEINATYALDDYNKQKALVDGLIAMKKSFISVDYTHESAPAQLDGVAGAVPETFRRVTAEAEVEKPKNKGTKA